MIKIFFLQLNFAKKKRIGPSRDENNRKLFFKKDIGILARNGFSFETSKRIMDLSKEEYEKIIRLLWFSRFFYSSNNLILI